MKTNDAMRPNRRLVLRSALGLLVCAREIDYGSAVFGRPMSAAELRQALGLKP